MKDLCFYCMAPKEAGMCCPRCGGKQAHNEPHQLPVGTRLHNSYLTGRVLGQGGFGITYLAWDAGNGRQVAIKEFFPTAFAGRTYGGLVTNTGGVGQFQDGLNRFVREAELLQKLQSVREIVRVYDFFKENGTAYLVMEYLQGMDLREYLKVIGRVMTPEETIGLLTPIMRALEKVHNTGLVHRDISPDNIMLVSGGTVKLLDFGIAKDLSGNLPKSTNVALKHGYAPMEQYTTGGNIGAWTDEYALCGTAYYCMTGRIPPEAASRAEGANDLGWEKIPGMRPQWAEAFRKGSSFRPQDRYPNIGLLEQQLAIAGPKPDPQPNPVPQPKPVQDLIINPQQSMDAQLIYHPQASPDPDPQSNPVPQPVPAPQPSLLSRIGALLLRAALVLAAYAIMQGLAEALH